MKVIEPLKLQKFYLFDDLDPDPSEWLPSAHQFYSPWKLAVTSVHLQLILKELGRALNRESTREHALSNLEKVSRELFSHRITHEEAYYIGEVARGVDDAVLGKVRESTFNTSTGC
jgi:mediator of RNA polymerase II transcription subunit 12, fungi type